MHSVAVGIAQLAGLRHAISPADRGSHESVGVDRESEGDRCTDWSLGDPDCMPVAHDVEFDRVGLVGEDLGPYSLALTVSRVGRAGGVAKGDMRAGDLAACEIAAFEQHSARDQMRTWGDRHFEFLDAAVACVAAEAFINLCRGRCTDACKGEEGRQEWAQDSIERYQHVTPLQNGRARFE